MSEAGPQSWREHTVWQSAIHWATIARDPNRYDPGNVPSGVVSMSDAEFAAMTPWHWLECCVADWGRFTHLDLLSPSRQFSSIQGRSRWITMTGDPEFLHVYGAIVGCSTPDWHQRSGGGHLDRLAQLGSDGRYHLIDPETGRCITSPRDEVHSWFCTVVVGGSVEYRAANWCRPDLGESMDTYMVRAPVEYVGPRVNPRDVSKMMRCPQISQADWPRPDSGTRVGLMRRELIEAYGQQCMICQLRFATVVDHDHFTGRVRGLLCHECNLWIDGCDDLEGCWRTNYLNAPPLGDLGLMYPNAATTRRTEVFRRTVAVIEKHDEFAHLRPLLPPKPRSRQNSGATRL